MDKYRITPEVARQMLDYYGQPYDRMVDDKERRKITSISRTTAYELAQVGRYPTRRKMGVGSKKCGWLLSELLHWIHDQPQADKAA